MCRFHSDCGLMCLLGGRFRRPHGIGCPYCRRGCRSRETSGAARGRRPGEVGCGEQKPQPGREGGRPGGREDGPPAPAGGGKEGGQPGHRQGAGGGQIGAGEESLASQRAEEWEVRFNALQAHMERAEASTRSEVERTRKQLVDSYRELGAWTADFEVPDREAGLRFLEWLQEELLALPTIVEGFMSFASLVTCEGAMNALSREGCSHYEGFDRSDEDFGHEIFKVEDPVVKDSAGALFDRMWGPHGQEAVRERSDRARDQVKFVFCFVSLNVGIRGFAESVCCVVDGACRGRGGLQTSEQRAARSRGQPGGGRG